MKSSEFLKKNSFPFLYLKLVYSPALSKDPKDAITYFLGIPMSSSILVYDFKIPLPHLKRLKRALQIFSEICRALQSAPQPSGALQNLLQPLRALPRPPELFRALKSLPESSEAAEASRALRSPSKISRA